MRPGWGRFDIGDRHLLRAGALHGLGRAEDAEAAAAQALDGAATRLGPIADRVLRIRTLLAAIRDSAGRSATATAERTPDASGTKAGRAEGPAA